MNPSGMLMIPGFASEYHDSAPPSESGPGHTVGLITTSAMELMTPNSTPTTAPVVLKRRQVSDSSSAGKLALAATANARPTMNETFGPRRPGSRCRSRSRRSRTPRSSPPRPPRARSPGRGGRCSTTRRAPPRPTPRSPGPATTARIVANATAATIASSRSPPRCCGERRHREVAGLAGGLLARLAEDRARAEAERRRHQVEGADQDHRPDHGLAGGLGVGTVKNRIRMCGSPAVPSTSAEAERHRVERGRQEQARLAGTPAPSDDCARASREQVDRVPADLGQHPDGQHDAAREHQDRLDDLHPGRREHAAEDDVGEHERARSGSRPSEKLIPTSASMRTPAPTICAIR